MGLGVSATSDEPKPVDGTDPILTDPSAQPADGTVINPCGENVEVCIFSSGEGTATEGKVCSIDSKGVESCEAVTVGAPDEGVVTGSEGGEVAPDCQKDPTVCQRADDGVIYTMAPADGKYEDGIYYMNGDKDTGVAKDTTMVTISVGRFYFRLDPVGHCGKTANLKRTKTPCEYYWSKMKHNF